MTTGSFSNGWVSWNWGDEGSVSYPTTAKAPKLITINLESLGDEILLTPDQVDSLITALQESKEYAEFSQRHDLRPLTAEEHEHYKPQGTNAQIKFIGEAPSGFELHAIIETRGLFVYVLDKELDEFAGHWQIICSHSEAKQLLEGITPQNALATLQTRGTFTDY